MASETVTPNVGLQVAGYNQPNWQVPTNFNWNLLDLIFGGEVTVPALSVSTLTISNVGVLFASVFMQESPAGAFPGNTYTLSYAPSVLLAFCYNGAIQRLGIDYTRTNAVITTTFSTSSGDTVYALYLR